ncbi:MAG: hypothetical protein ACK5LV_08925, partial [Lachnospirales bacterium]
FGYVAVTELLSDNSVVHVFDGNGLMYSLTDIEGQVSYISINNSGYLSIITNINEEYQVKVLNDKGELFLISDFKDGTTVPITCAVSHDNSTLFINQLDLNKLIPTTLSVYYDLTTQGNDNIFALFEHSEDKDYIFYSNFFNNNKLLSISDKYINIISTENNSRDIETSIVLNNEIKLAKMFGSNLIVVYGKPINDNSIYPENTVQIIDSEGNQINIDNSRNTSCCWS